MEGIEFDLNLFKVFKVIYQTRNISKAAQKLKVSQPTVSKSLTKLRNSFDDPLFVYSGKTMQPTELAQQMFQSVLEGVNLLQGALNQNMTFNPKEGPHLFRIGMSDYLETIMLPRLLHHLKDEESDVGIEVEHIHLAKRHEALEEGFVDINIHGSIQGVHHQKYGSGIVQKFLYEDRYVFVMGSQFAPKKNTISLDELAELPQARYGISRVIDQLLIDHGLRRNVVLQVPHILVLPQIIVKNKLLVTLPERLARHFSKQLSLRILEPPCALPSLRFHMYWHERNKKSIGHIWLRNTLLELLKLESLSN